MIFSLKKKLLLASVATFLLTNCSFDSFSDSLLETKNNLFEDSSKYPPEVPSQCYRYEGKDGLEQRERLFPDLSSSEIASRNQMSLQPYPKGDITSNTENVLNKIIEAYNNAEVGARFIPVDLREYKEVNFGNLALSNLDSTNTNFEYLNKFTSYKERNYIVLNVNENSSKIFMGNAAEGLYKDAIPAVKNRADLFDSELVINLNHSNIIPNYYPTILGNLKLSGNKKISKKISILAKNITLEKLSSQKGGIRLNIEEFKESFINMATQTNWNLIFYDISESYIRSGKYNVGKINYLINKDIIGKNFDSFDVKVKCYYDPSNEFTSK